MRTLPDDLRYAARLLMRAPGFTLAALLTLALSTGLTTTIFSAVNAVLIRELPYPEPSRLVMLWGEDARRGQHRSQVCLPDVEDVARSADALEGAAAFSGYWSPVLSGSAGAEQLHGVRVSDGFFQVMKSRPMLGREFLPQEQLSKSDVAILSYELWARSFGHDAGIVGRKVTLSGRPYTVVGVMPRSFRALPVRLAEYRAEIYRPLGTEFGDEIRSGRHLRAIGRLKAGASESLAQQQVGAAALRLEQQYPDSNTGRGIRVVSLREEMVAEVRPSLLVLQGCVLLIVLIGCANVANLLLVRATGHRREFAIRAALGASRARIVRQLLTESVLLSLAGGVLGLVFGLAGVRALLALSPAGLPRVGEGGAAIGMDWRVLAFTLVVSLTTGILFGLVPAFSASRADLNTTLKENSTRSGSGIRQGKARSLLIVTEVSLALVLLVGSALLIRTLAALRGVDPGFDAHNVLTLEMSMTGGPLHTAAGVSQLSRQGRERLNALPGVQLAATSVWLPNQVDDGLPFQIIGRPADKSMAGARFTSISPGFLEVFKIPLLRGRDINENDIAGKPGVVLINQALAKQYWPNEDPVGQHMMIGGDIGPTFAGETIRTVIGIVGDTHNNGLGHPSDGMMIVPTAQVPDGYQAAYSDTSALVWVVRTHADPHALIPVITEQLRLASHGFPVAHVRTMDEVMGRSTPHESFNMILLSIFGLVALALAAIGIYGVMAYTVAQRTQEMGIRMALGADRSAIRKLVVWHGMRLALVGVVLGIAAAFGLTRLIASFLFGVTMWDPAAFLLAPLILSAVALLAVWLPAARASKVDPMQALRVE